MSAQDNSPAQAHVLSQTQDEAQAQAQSQSQAKTQADQAQPLDDSTAQAAIQAAAQALGEVSPTELANQVGKQENQTSESFIKPENKSESELKPEDQQKNTTNSVVIQSNPVIKASVSDTQTDSHNPDNNDVVAPNNSTDNSDSSTAKSSDTSVASISSAVKPPTSTAVKPPNSTIVKPQPPTSPNNNLPPQKLEGNYPEILKVLVSNHVLTVEQAQQINGVHLTSNKPIEDILQDSELVSELDLTKAKAELNQVPFIIVHETGVAPEALTRVDESVARRYTALPFALDQETKIIKVAMADPLNVTAINFLEQKTGLKVEAYYATESEIKRLISERYAQDLSSDVTAAIEETSSIKTGDLDLLQGQQGGFIKAAPINKIVNTTIDYALQSRASDIHIEPLAAKTRVRFRIDGILQEKLILPKSVHDAVVSRIKILSDLKIDEKRVPQDGRFDYSSGNKAVDLRVSTMPSTHGEKVVMRLLMKNQAIPGLEELGLRGLALQTLNKAIRIPHGIFLVTGPTGSGKTTTLYSILNIINTPRVNIMTLEDPVEYQMTGVTQVQVRPQAGLTFANGLRSFLRQDPDIIMVGEIRDSETAELAVQASLTGHLVFSTLHTNSAAGALPRLVDMKIEPFLLSSSIILVMAQRVVRKINEDYREEYKPDEEMVADLKKVLGAHFEEWCTQNNKDPNNVVLYRARKDRPQTEPEYKGRTGIFEVLNITDEVKHLINKRAPASEINDLAMKNGMMLMKQDGYLKALEGITTIEEVLRVAEVK